jgi:hypothetical protein
MHEFKIEVTREGRWWMVHIPDIDGLTQARRLSEAETMAREYISLAKGIPVDDISIETASVRMQQPEFRELLDTARQIRDERDHARGERARAQELESTATSHAREYAQLLTAYGVPVRDVATLLDISPQRVSQLTNS